MAARFLRFPAPDPLGAENYHGWKITTGELLPDRNPLLTSTAGI